MHRRRAHARRRIAEVHRNTPTWSRPFKIPIRRNTTGCESGWGTSRTGNASILRPLHLTIRRYEFGRCSDSIDKYRVKPNAVSTTAGNIRAIRCTPCAVSCPRMGLTSGGRGHGRTRCLWLSAKSSVPGDDMSASVQHTNTVITHQSGRRSRYWTAIRKLLCERSSATANESAWYVARNKPNISCRRFSRHLYSFLFCT